MIGKRELNVNHQMTADEILGSCSHRPVRLPREPWFMRQQWHDLLFAHWAVNPASLVSQIPAGLSLDLWDGKAYVTVTPFIIRGLRLRGLPRLPFASQFPEVNVRTYVTCQGIPGVFFFSLDAASLSAVLGARTLYKLPYYRAEMKVRHHYGHIEYTSRRLPAFRRQFEAELDISYGAGLHELPWRPPSESLERFLTERYCLYASHGRQLLRAYIHHLPWPLQPATAIIRNNTMLREIHIEPQQPPIMHFSRFIDVLVWRPERV